jgi:uncharacterized protein YndB with AHSA1/START domain
MNDGIADITPCYTMSFSRSSKHSARRVWSAITDPAEIERWMDYPARVDLGPGGDYRIDFSRTGIAVDEQKANWERLRAPYLERLNAVLRTRNKGP